MSVYAVIDTNVIVSALLNDDSIPGFIINCIGNHIVIPIIHDSIIDEYKDVLNRKKFNFDKTIVDTFVASIKRIGYYASIIDSKRQFIDENDKKFYDLYYSVKKENVFLITGNKKHFPNENNIVSPREFLGVLANI